ncbi:MAG: 4-(cytidine 5'-diphospho)-2-C-methyl-D-erythritol kinase [Muribaculaceae bacterium]|nr:4-(cytidine 5'-diphospho)-2-C-methyl-D-erythritol kinase [Muribaculaceae bacterium]
MISFVNAKINIGLQIVRKREDGYHDLETLFYPIGLYAGTPNNPTPFCDILEIVSEKERQADCNPKNENLPEFLFAGRSIDCALEKNLVYKAADLFCRDTGADLRDLQIILEKHLPDGAGLGGGSADAAFTLKMLAEIFNSRNPQKRITDKTLYEMALKIGADCPFFILNRPAFAEGVGERLDKILLDLTGYTLLLVKPDIYVSTKDAFSGVVPRKSDFDLRHLADLPIEKWRGVVKNDFEDSIFPKFPGIKKVKERIYSHGAIYASMSGSGSSVYGIFGDEVQAAKALNDFKDESTIEACYLLKM